MLWFFASQISFSYLKIKNPVLDFRRMSFVISEVRPAKSIIIYRKVIVL